MPLSTKQLVNRLRTIALPAALAASTLLGAGVLLHGNHVHAAAVSAAPLDDSSVAALTALDQAMESLAARVTPAVVNVAVTARPEESADPEEGDAGNGDPQGGNLPPGLGQFFGFGDGSGPQGSGPQGSGPQSRGGRLFRQGRPPLQRGIGSGVIIAPDGYIVTNNHVVAGATEIKVTLHDRRVLTGKVIGTDKQTDLAIIKVDAHDLPAMTWGDSTKLQPGQTVLAFGSPFGYLRFSVTRGIVSALDRQDPYSNDPRHIGNFIQTDAAVNPGNSGGPLVNARGELVGINSMIATSSGSFAGASFAIPSQIARSVADQIIKTGAVHHGYLGISMNDVTAENAHFFNLNDAVGAVVAQVTPNSPASQAGLKDGDVIQQVNGHPALNGSAVQVAIGTVTPGTKVDLGILRNGKAQTVPLTVGEFHADTQVAANESDSEAPAAQGGGKLGLSMSDVTPDIRQQLRLPEEVRGAAIAGVRPGSPAEDAGLQPGDIIIGVNRHPVVSAKEAVTSVRALPANQDVLLLVWSRGGQSYRVLRPNQG